MNTARIIAAVTLTLALAGCGTMGTGLNSRQRAITVYYEDVDGTVKTRPLYLDRIDNGPARSLCDLECAEWLASS